MVDTVLTGLSSFYVDLVNRILSCSREDEGKETFCIHNLADGRFFGVPVFFLVRVFYLSSTVIVKNRRRHRISLFSFFEFLKFRVLN